MLVILPIICGIIYLSSSSAYKSGGFSIIIPILRLLKIHSFSAFILATVLSILFGKKMLSGLDEHKKIIFVVCIILNITAYFLV